MNIVNFYILQNIFIPFSYSFVFISGCMDTLFSFYCLSLSITIVFMSYTHLKCLLWNNDDKLYVFDNY